MQASETHDERPVFERGLAIARRNLLLLAICLVTVPAAALAYSLLQTPQYTASASLLFGTQSIESQLFELTPTDSDPQREAATNLKLVSVDQVAVRTARAIDEPGLTVDAVSEKVSVSPEGESNLVAVEATDPDPALATALANEFARQYIAYSRDEARDRITRAQALVEAKLEELTPGQLEGAAGRALNEQAGELEALAALQTGDAELAQAATEPTSPSSPRTTRNVALGLVLGLLLGIGLALLREQLDRRLRDLEGIEDVFHLPVLGTIPRSRALLESGPGAELEPTGAEGEAFRMLRANLLYFNVDREITSILLTSAAPQDGKTTVAWNLARTEARAGTKILYIEADMRRPRLATALGLKGDDGLSLVLAGASQRDTAIVNVHGVDLLQAGPLPPNPAELIESKRMVELLSWAEEQYERVIVDTPPAAVVADAVPLFNRVGGVVIVARMEKSPRQPAESLRDQLANTHAPALGLVVNGIERPSDSSYYRPRATVPNPPKPSGNEPQATAKPTENGPPDANLQPTAPGSGNQRSS